MDEQRGTREETLGGYLDLAGTFEGSQITLDQMQILTLDDNRSDHLPVLTTALITDDSSLPFEKVKRMIRQELELFATDDLLNNFVSNINDRDEIDIENLIIFFNYFMVIKDIFAQAELLRLNGDTESIADAITINGAFDPEFRVTGHHLDEDDSAPMLTKLIKLGHESLHDLCFEGDTDTRQDTIKGMKTRCHNIINNVQLSRSNGSFLTAVAETFNRFFRSVGRFLGIKADLTHLQKRELHQERLSQSQHALFSTSKNIVPQRQQEQDVTVQAHQ